MHSPTRILTDTSFWIAYYDRRDRDHAAARTHAHLLDRTHLLLPWPILYETLGTRFVKNSAAMQHFERVLLRQNVYRLDDQSLREAALEQTLRAGARGQRPISLCDHVIRHLLERRELRITGLLSFNPRDFADLCRTRQIELLGPS
jgi:predicted nucleic acid-binding protein